MTNSIYSVVKPYVYVCIHRETSAIYIGARSANEVPAVDDLGTFYFTSSPYVSPIFNEFDYEILFEGNSSEEVFKFEGELIKEHWKKPYLINRQNNGKFNFAGKKHTDEAIQKITNFQRGRKLPPRSKEHAQKISDAKIGKPLSDEHKQKIKVANKGKEFTEEHKSNLSKSAKGKKKGPMSEENKAKHRGKKHSVESRIKMSDALKGKKQQIVVCPHCGKEGGLAAMKQWHFNNCKNRNNEWVHD
jgi:hypothetical protein